MQIHKGDQVIVLSGKDKGKKAEVVRAIPSRNSVILEGVNVAKRHPSRHARHPTGWRHRQVHARPRLDRGPGLQELRQAHTGRLPLRGRRREGAHLQEVRVGAVSTVMAPARPG